MRPLFAPKSNPAFQDLEDLVVDDDGCIYRMTYETIVERSFGGHTHVSRQYVPRLPMRLGVGTTYYVTYTPIYFSRGEFDTRLTNELVEDAVRREKPHSFTAGPFEFGIDGPAVKEDPTPPPRIA